LTEGERHLLKFLDDHLKKDDLFQADDLTKYNGWLIFVQPFLNGSRPDIVILHPNIGVQIFEVKDWNLGNYSFKSKANGDKDSEAFYVSDGKGTYPTKSPVKQVVTKTIIWRFWEAIPVVHNRIFALLSVLICREKRLKESKRWRKVVEEP